MNLSESMVDNEHFLTSEEDNLCFADVESDFELISKVVIEEEHYKSCTHASHCMIYSKSSLPVLETYNTTALILMQFRFDGYIGFPGGIVDSGESAVKALNRELSEEQGLSSLVEFVKEDRVFIHYNKHKSLMLHFFLKEVSLEDFREIEIRSTKAPEYGNEVLGLLRVPLYTMSDGYRGFPAFLCNKFIGNSKQQLLESLKLLNLMSSEEIENALKAEPLYLKKNKGLVGGS